MFEVKNISMIYDMNTDEKMYALKGISNFRIRGLWASSDLPEAEKVRLCTVYRHLRHRQRETWNITGSLLRI